VNCGYQYCVVSSERGSLRVVSEVYQRDGVRAVRVVLASSGDGSAGACAR
jgi:hypothetical protein